MRTLACLAAASLLSLAPSLARAQTPWAAPNAPADAPSAGATVIVTPAPALPAAAPYAAPAPVWYGAHSPDPVVMRRRNTGLMIGGLVMIPVGLAMGIGGGVLIDRVNNEASPCQPASTIWAVGGAAACGIGAGYDRAMRSLAAYWLAVAGPMVGVGGIVLAAVGGSKVPAKPRWRPEVSVGAGSMSMRWTF